MGRITPVALLLHWTRGSARLEDLTDVLRLTVVDDAEEGGSSGQDSRNAEEDSRTFLTRTGGKE